MAGIGFTLKKALGGRGALGRAGVYGAAAFVAAGPWLLTLLTMFLLLAWGRAFGVDQAGGDLFFATVTYAMIGSNLISSTAQFFLTRYLADALYVEAHERLLSAFTGVFAYTGLAALMFGGGLQALLPLPLTYKIWTVVLTVILTQLGLVMILLSAAKSYNAIARGFLLAVLVVAAGALLLAMFGTTVGITINVTSMVALFTVGQGVAMVRMGGVAVREFPGQLPALYGLWAQHKRYPELLGIGFFYAISLWLDNAMYWRSDAAVTVANSYWLAPAYDLAKFWTFLSFIPAFTVFAVSVETHFYVVFRRFYDAIESGQALAPIRLYEEDLRAESKAALWQMFKVQAFVALIAWVIAQQLIDRQPAEVDVFQWTILGSIPHMIWITTFLLLLYFDARKRALWSVVLAALSLLGGTYLALLLDWPTGSGYVVGCLLMAGIGIWLLNRQTERLLFYAFHDPNGRPRELPPAAIATPRQQQVGYPILHPFAAPHVADGEEGEG